MVATGRTTAAGRRSSGSRAGRQACRGRPDRPEPRPALPAGRRRGGGPLPRSATGLARPAASATSAPGATTPVRGTTSRAIRRLGRLLPRLPAGPVEAHPPRRVTRARLRHAGRGGNSCGVLALDRPPTAVFVFTTFPRLGPFARPSTRVRGRTTSRSSRTGVWLGAFARQRYPVTPACEIDRPRADALEVMAVGATPDVDRCAVPILVRESCGALGMVRIHVMFEHVSRFSISATLPCTAVVVRSGVQLFCACGAWLRATSRRTARYPLSRGQGTAAASTRVDGRRHLSSADPGGHDAARRIFVANVTGVRWDRTTSSSAERRLTSRTRRSSAANRSAVCRCWPRPGVADRDGHLPNGLALSQDSGL